MIGTGGKRGAASLCRTGVLASGWIAASCIFETASLRPADPALGHRLDYLVSAASGSRGCRVEITLRAWPEGEAKIFQAPIFYADNPVMPAPGYKAADLIVRDGAGNVLAARDTAIEGIGIDGNLIVLPPSARTFSYAVDLAPGDSLRFGLPIPGTAEGTDLIDGAYFFLLPLLDRDFAAQWRTPATFTLEFAPIPGRTLVGTDAERTFADNYGMMFVRGAYDPVRSKTYPMGNHDVTIYATSNSAFDLDSFSVVLGKCLKVVEDSLLPLPTRRYFAGENPQFWGIEGVQGYWFKAEAANLPDAHVHELAHTFVGVYQSDYEDPWWKEGVTDYLGRLLSVQTGLIGDTAFAANVLSLHDTLASARRYALSDPYIRGRLFPAMDSAFVEHVAPLDLVGLVYGKGCQAAMILDRYILERSGGKRSIFDLIRALAREGTAFHRSDLEASIDTLAGGSSSAFLHSLLDQAAPLGADSLAHTYSALRGLGRFGPEGGKHPVAGVDPSPAPKPSAGGAAAAGGSPSRHVGGIPKGAKL